MRKSYLRNSQRWVAALAATLVLTGGTVLLAQTGGLRGKATLQDGTPCVKCPVLIERQDIKGNYPVKTDKKGEYIYIGLPIGNYKITLQDPNGRTLFFFDHVHVGLGDPAEKDFDLATEVAAVKKEQEANPVIKKQLEEQAKEQKQTGNAQQLFSEGKALEGEKKYVEAAAKFEEAIPLVKGQNLAVVLQNAANSYRQARQYDKSLDLLQKAIEANPADPTVHDMLGNLYADMRKIPEAQAEFQKAAELNPSGAAHEYFNLGATMYNQGKMDEAAAAFKKATDTDPKYADAYFMEGRALMGKLTVGSDGKVIAAPGTTEALQAYLKTDPNGKYAAEAQAMLQTIQGSVQTEYKATKKKR
jgi:tetratricopeptide (TPR) repeat protein